MNGLCARVFLIALVELHCCSAFEVQMKETFEQLALPRVTCYDHKIEAVFGPMVKTNVHVQGKKKKNKESQLRSTRQTVTSLKFSNCIVEC